MAVMGARVRVRATAAGWPNSADSGRRTAPIGAPQIDPKDIRLGLRSRLFLPALSRPFQSYKPILRDGVWLLLPLPARLTKAASVDAAREASTLCQSLL